MLFQARPSINNGLQLECTATNSGLRVQLQRQ